MRRAPSRATSSRVSPASSAASTLSSRARSSTFSIGWCLLPPGRPARVFSCSTGRICHLPHAPDPQLPVISPTTPPERVSVRVLSASRGTWTMWIMPGSCPHTITRLPEAVAVSSPAAADPPGRHGSGPVDSSARNAMGARRSQEPPTTTGTGSTFESIQNIGPFGDCPLTPGDGRISRGVVLLPANRCSAIP